MTEEIWKDVKCYEGRCKISNLGRVKSLHYQRSNKG
nr:MAG TPA: NUMOD4 motif protein [Caudoviricetes sp.]